MSLSPPLHIGIISDTHGLIRPAAVEALRGVALILHAGDVGGEHILAPLRALAPVKVVRGNTDTDPWGRRLPLFETASIGPDSIYMHHGHLEPGIDFHAAGFKVVVSGHTHIPHIEWRRDILHINPGSAGHRRSSLPATVARLTLTGHAHDAHIIELDC